MNKEEIRKQFEIAALGCLDNEQYRQFIQAVSEDEELQKEFGKYQKVAALIPFSLKFQQPPVEVKNKVVVGIKKIILSKIKETKPVVQQTEEKKVEVVEPEIINVKIEDTIQTEIQESPDNSIPQAEEVISETIDNSVDEMLEEEILSPDFTQEPVEQIKQEPHTAEPPEVKVNIDYSNVLKEEIVEEVTKRIKKTINYQFEEFENKINKKNKFIKVLLIIITLLTLLLVASNVYQFFYPTEKKVEIKKEIRTPALESPDSLL
jgi:hypothetical protein